MTEEDHLRSSLRHTIEDGTHRIARSWPALLATGAVGGIDVSVGVFALLLVKSNSHSDLLGALAFSIGFIALTLANSELFTENYLVPITAVAAGRSGPAGVLRLWGGTLVTNLLGGLLMAALIVNAFPDLGPVAVELTDHFDELGIGWEAFLSAILAGIIITLMTWMQAGDRKGDGARIVAAVVAGFLLAYGEMTHVIVASLEIFAGMLSGAAMGVGEWAGFAVMMAAGNMIGGIGMVTVLRLVQLGRERIAEEERRGADDDSQPSGEASRGVSSEA